MFVIPFGNLWWSVALAAVVTVAVVLVVLW